MKCFVVLAAIAAVCNSSSIYAGAGYFGQPIFRTSYSAPISPLNAYPGALQAYAAGAPFSAGPLAAAAPLAAAPLPAVPLPTTPLATPFAATFAVENAVGPVSTQYHNQDEFGNYNYGYSNINSAKVESGNALTGVTGSYTVNDGHGIRRVDYVADALGFRPVRK